MFPPLTESQALRACNLPDTPHWRNWLRGKLSPQEISTGRIYDRGLVERLAEKIRPLAGSPTPEPQRQTAPDPPRVGFSSPTDSGIKPRTKRQAAVPLKNRNGPQLETR